MRLNRIASAAALLLVSGFALPAQAEEWKLLGERKVNLGADRDTIPVSEAKPFKRIRLQVEDAPIELLDLEVHFENGGKQDVEVRAELSAGSYTRAIDLTGEARRISKVVCVYRTKLKGKRRAQRATVRVYGLQVGGSAEPKATPEPVKKAPPKIEWVQLGERKVDFGADKDVIPVTAAEGSFRTLRFKIGESAVRIRSLSVQFVNGESCEVSVKEDFEAGSHSRAIDLPGAARRIKQVTVLYRSKLKGAKGRATLTLFGARVVGSEPEEGPAKPEQPREGPWVDLGQRTVGWNVDRDEIPVTVAEGRFTKLRFKVSGHKIHLLRVKIVYAQGDPTDLTPDVELAAGAMSPVLDLPGNKRIVQKVVFWYKSEPNQRRRRAQQKATVSLEGKH